MNRGPYGHGHGPVDAKALFLSTAKMPLAASAPPPWRCLTTASDDGFPRPHAPSV